ncbi:MAG: helix-turn-helix domain-containing protein [Rhodothalassiaceae bacterium]
MRVRRLVHQGEGTGRLTRLWTVGARTPLTVAALSDLRGGYTIPTDDRFLLVMTNGRPVSIGLGAAAAQAPEVWYRGSFALQPPDTAMQYHCHDPAEAVAVLIRRADVATLLASDTQLFCGDFGRLQGRRQADPTVERIVSELVRECRVGRRPGSLYFDGLAAILVARLHDLSCQAAPARESLRQDAGRLSRVLAMIDERLEEALSLATLAEAAGCSPFHLSRLFTSRLGCPPHAYLVRKRVERACALLDAGHLSLAQIALACGFSSQSHFTTMFKRQMAMTPGQYRKRRQLAHQF